MNKQWVKVSADKDADIVLVITREAAAVIRTHLQDCAEACTSAGCGNRARLISDVVSELDERLHDEN